MHQSRGDHVIQYANDRYCHGRLLACADCWISRATEERIDFIFDQCGGAFHEQLGTPFPVDNLEVLSLHKASAAQFVKKRRVTGICSRSNDEYTDAIGAARLLGVYRQRQSGSHTTDEPNELPALHSITSSARASNAGGTVRPSALAVLRFMTSSNFVGCSIGRS